MGQFLRVPVVFWKAQRRELQVEEFPDPECTHAGKEQIVPVLARIEEKKCQSLLIWPLAGQGKKMRLNDKSIPCRRGIFCAYLRLCQFGVVHCVWEIG